MFADRAARVRARMAELGVDVVLLSVGPDLPYLTGYEAMPLERLTMLVLPMEGDATLVVPRLEAPRVAEQPEPACGVVDELSFFTSCRSRSMRLSRGSGGAATGRAS